jgi:ribonuclease HI
MNNQTQHRASQTIAILQYNLRKNRITTDSVLNAKTSRKYAILLLQEQHFSSYKNTSLIHKSWTLIESKATKNKPPRAAIYLNKTMLPPHSYESIPTGIPDTVAIALRLDHEQHPTLIINIYNTKNSSQLTDLRTYLRKHLRNNIYNGIIIAGDFNLHHPLWNPPNRHDRDSGAEVLIDVMTQLQLKPMLPKGTITFPRAKTAIDLVWGNKYVEQRIIKCRIAKSSEHGSDHLPIETILNLQPCPYGPEAQRPYNYKKTDWKIFEGKLQSYLPILNPFRTPTIETVDILANDISLAIRRTTVETTPRADICPFSNRWWSKELDDLRKRAQRARRKFNKYGRSEDEKDWKKKRRIYRRKIEEAKRNTWQKYVSTADERSIFKVNGYLTSTSSNTYIPTLEGEAATNSQKTDTLTHTFFPQPPPADLSDIPGAIYPDSVPTKLIITGTQVKRAIEKLAPNKAPGPDEIPNHVLKRCLSILQPHILELAQQSFHSGHFPQLFKDTTTLVLRKPNKPNYTKPNAYRPIALENTIGKVLESIMTEHISYLCETFNLLPKNHFGGRPGRSTEDAMLILSENIHQAWKKGKIFSAILMDVSGAFNNVHHERLLHNMRKRRIPKEVTQWIASFLSNRTTRMRFNGITTTSIPTPTGIPQGSPLSPILYILYNSDLLDIPSEKQLGLGFIDDILYGTQNKTATANAKELERLLAKSEQWRQRHGAQFEKSKYVLIHFTRKLTVQTRAFIKIAGTTIHPSTEAKYLGVIFDQKLKFRSHIQHIADKITKYAFAIAGIAKSKWGPKFEHLRRLFTAVAAPRIDYGAIIWHRPGDTRTAPTTSQLRTLASLQGKIMRAITGCFRTTSIQALEHETGLLSPKWRLTDKILQTTTRMMSTATNHPIHAWINRAINHGGPPYMSNLENLARHFPKHMQPGMEHIATYIRPPCWELKATTEIKQANKKEAAQAHQQRLKQISPQDLIIYTDGSGHDGHVGAAIYSPTLRTAKGKYVGTDETHNVYAAELMAIQMAVSLTEEKIEEYTNVHIFTDNQSAIQAIESPRKQSGQYIIKGIIDITDRIHAIKPTTNIRIEWVPGHENIDGNEQADQAAKTAATPNATPPTIRMRSAQKRLIQSSMKTKWETEWKTGKKNAARLRKMSQHPGTTSGLKLYGVLQQRKHVVWISRLRTGHCHLNEYLHRFNIIETAECECGASKETVDHYLLNCELYDEERDSLRRKVGVQGMRTGALLGDSTIIKETVKYIERTERFKLEQG